MTIVKVKEVATGLRNKASYSEKKARELEVESRILWREASAYKDSADLLELAIQHEEKEEK